jgi:hypothetical protein
LKKTKEALTGDKTMDSISSVYAAAQELHISARGWLDGDPDSSYQSWKKEMPVRGKSWRIFWSLKKGQLLKVSIFSVNYMHVALHICYL